MCAAYVPCQVDDPDVDYRDQPRRREDGKERRAEEFDQVPPALFRRRGKARVDVRHAVWRLRPFLCVQNDGFGANLACTAITAAEAAWGKRAWTARGAGTAAC